MPHPLIDRAFYEAITHFDESDKAQETYYRIMDTVTESGGRRDTVRNQILRAYAMLFCDDIGAVAGQAASVDDVEATADRLYVGFAALVIADLSAGPLHEAAVNGEDMLLVGEPNPLDMTPSQRRHQQVRVIRTGGGLA